MGIKNKNSVLLFLGSFRTYFLIFGLLLFFSGCASLKIKETEIGSGWANNSVNTVIFRQNAITTFRDHQFTAYYDEDSNLIWPNGNWKAAIGCSGKLNTKETQGMHITQ
jgi:hypothetical protein